MINIILRLIWLATETDAEKKLSQSQKEKIGKKLFEQSWFGIALWRTVVFYILFGGILIFLQVREYQQELPSPYSGFYTGFWAGGLIILAAVIVIIYTCTIKMTLKKFMPVRGLLLFINVLGWTVTVIGIMSAYVYFTNGYEKYTGADGKEHIRLFYGTIFTGLFVIVGLGIEATSAALVFSMAKFFRAEAQEVYRQENLELAH